MSLATRQPWDVGTELAVISDGGSGVGMAALVIANDFHLRTGGFSILHQAEWLKPYGLKPADNYAVGLRQNALNADAVLVLAEDPRSEVVNASIIAAKERHTKVRVVVITVGQPSTQVEDTALWLEDARIVYVAGLAPFNDAARFLRALIPVWAS